MRSDRPRSLPGDFFAGACRRMVPILRNRSAQIIDLVILPLRPRRSRTRITTGYSTSHLGQSTWRRIVSLTPRPAFRSSRRAAKASLPITPARASTVAKLMPVACMKQLCHNEILRQSGGLLIVRWKRRGLRVGKFPIRRRPLVALVGAQISSSTFSSDGPFPKTGLRA
jgi:hypothetical protein